jgi:SAM-dependent methyltransferase
MEMDDDRGFEAVAANYDTFAEQYDGTYRDAVSRYERETLQRILHRYLKAGSVLDLGCGTGMFLDLGFRPPPADYLGVDVSEGMVRVARLKHPGYRFIVADFCSVALPSAVNVVALNAPLSYVLDGNLDFLTELVNPGGRLVVTLYGKGDGVVERHDRGRAAHAASIVRRYTVRRAREALSAFVIVHVRGSNACLPLGTDHSPVRWLANAILERVRPSETEHIILCGVRVTDGVRGSVRRNRAVVSQNQGPGY